MSLEAALRDIGTGDDASLEVEGCGLILGLVLDVNTKLRNGYNLVCGKACVPSTVAQQGWLVAN